MAWFWKIKVDARGAYQEAEVDNPIREYDFFLDSYNDTFEHSIVVDDLEKRVAAMEDMARYKWKRPEYRSCMCDYLIEKCKDREDLIERLRIAKAKMLED